MTAGTRKRHFHVPILAYALVTVLAFVLVPALARMAGYWQTSTTPDLYRALYQMEPQVAHPQVDLTASPHSGWAPAPSGSDYAGPRPTRWGSTTAK